MTPKTPICPDRIRSIPDQFSWVDHRLVRDRYLDRVTHKAAALYLFLVTVADVKGLSFYSDRTLCERLAMSDDSLDSARAELCQAGLVAWRSPIYQVLSLAPSPATKGCARPQSVGEILQRIAGGAR